MRKEIIAFGIILFVIGLGAYFYVEVHVLQHSYNFWGYQVPEVSYKEYPFRDLGELLLIIGIVLTSIGLVISSPPQYPPM